VAIRVAFDTHSGDLTQYNMTKLSALRDDKGKEVAPAAWLGTSNDSHHREGIIKFPRGIEQGTKYLELVIKDVGVVKERVLRWDMGGNKRLDSSVQMRSQCGTKIRKQRRYLRCLESSKGQ